MAELHIATANFAKKSLHFNGSKPFYHTNSNKFPKQGGSYSNGVQKKFHNRDSW